MRSAKVLDDLNGKFYVELELDGWRQIHYVGDEAEDALAFEKAVDVGVFYVESGWIPCELPTVERAGVFAEVFAFRARPRGLANACSVDAGARHE